jgi:hypothetical protein
MNKTELNAVFPKGSMGFRLLTPGNPKTEKGKGAGYWTFILHLAPASLSGFNVCAMATAGCKAACLNTAGRGGIMAGHGILTAADVANGMRNTIQAARIRKTKAFFAHRDAFMAVLCDDIARAIDMAERNGYKPAFRLNGTSDIRWETIDVNGLTVFERFNGVQFYDYTKIANRKNIPANYALTFSLADGNDESARQALANGMNVAAVFRDKAAVSRVVANGFAVGFKGAVGTKVYPVANGDETDLRFLDPRGHVIALYAKGDAKRDQSGFVRN